MACIIKKNNSSYWYVRYQDKDKIVDYSTKSRNHEVAKRIRNNIEDKIALRRFDLIPISSALTVEEWTKQFLEIQKSDNAKATVDRYTRSLNSFLSFCSNIKFMRQFTGLDIVKYKSNRSKQVSKTAVCNELSVIRRFFNLCEQLHKIPSPMKGIAIGEPDKKPPNIYSQDEIRKFFLIKDKRDRAIVLLDLQAGLRKGEMGSRRWKHIDFERDLIWVRREDGFIPKDKDNRFIPLKPETKKALLEWRKISKYNKEEDIVFPGKRGKIIGTYQRSKFDVLMSKVLERVGVKGHCQKFRDTFASYSLGCDVPPQNVQQWYGHSDFRTTQHYITYLPKAIEPDVRKLFEWSG